MGTSTQRERRPERTQPASGWDGTRSFPVSAPFAKLSQQNRRKVHSLSRRRALVPSTCLHPAHSHTRADFSGGATSATSRGQHWLNWLHSATSYWERDPKQSMLSVRLRKRRKKNIGQKELELLLMICIHTTANVRHFQVLFWTNCKGEFKHKKSPHLARMKVQKPNQQKKGNHFREKHPLSRTLSIGGTWRGN